MKVLLLQDVRGLGRKNDVVEARDGYARNFLIAKGLAQPYKGQAIKFKQKVDAELEMAIKQYHENVERLRNEKLVFKVKTGDKDEVFGGVAAGMIEEKLSQMGIGGGEVKLAHPLKALGEHEVEIHFGRGVHGLAKIYLEKE